MSDLRLVSNADAQLNHGTRCMTKATLGGAGAVAATFFDVSVLPTVAL